MIFTLTLRLRKIILIHGALKAQHYSLPIFVSYVLSIAPEIYQILNKKDSAVLEWDHDTQVAACYILSS